MPDEPPASQPSDTTRKPNGKPSGIIRDFIAVARGSDLVVVRVVGKGSMVTAPTLAEFLDQQRNAGFKRFVFDLERCTGLDSTFMGVMVGLHRALEAESGHFVAPVAQASGLRRNAENGPTAPDEVGGAKAAEPLAPMTPQEAVAALQELLKRPVPEQEAAASSGSSAPQPGGAAGAPGTVVSAVNVPREIADLMAMVGVDKFVRMRGPYDLRQLETTMLPEKSLSTGEQHRLILQAHENLVEIDKRNEARFGPFLKSLSQALAGEQS